MTSNTCWNGIFAAVALLALAPTADGQHKAKQPTAEPQHVTKTLRGHVTDEAGKPIAGVELARMWLSNAGGKFSSIEPTKSAADGSFSLEMTFYYGRANAIATIDVERQRGGL